MKNIIDPIIYDGWKPNGCSKAVINLQLIGAEKVIYAKEYKCQPHYRLYLSYQGEVRSIELLEKEFRSPNLFDIIFDKFEQLLPNFDRWIDPDKSEISSIIYQFRQDVKRLAGDNHLVTIPFFGGLFRDQNLSRWDYYRPLTYKMRTDLRGHSSAFGNLRELRSAPFFPSAACDILQITYKHFEHITDSEKRLFLFLYFHYAYYASFFANFKHSDVLCIDCPNQSSRSKIISFLFGLAQNNCFEVVQEHLPKAQFLQRFKETKDIPFLIESSAYAERSTLRAKIMALQYELGNAYTENRCVPIVFSERTLDINGVLHLSLEEKDFSATPPMHQFNIYRYITALMMNTPFAQSFYSEIPLPQQVNCVNTNLFLILRTIFNALVSIYQQAKLDLTPWLGSHSDIDDFLTWTLTKYSSDANIDSIDFSNELEELIANRTINNLSKVPNDNDAVLADFDSKACVRWNEERTAWEVNAQAFDTVLQNIGMPVSTYQALHALEQERFLCAPKINRHSYQSRIKFNQNDGKTLYRAAYVIKSRCKNAPAHDFTEPDWSEENENGYSLCFGQSITTGKTVHWSFQKSSNRHMRILGASGQGKSVFLESMLQQASQEKFTTVVFHLQGNLPDIEGAKVINIASQLPNISIESEKAVNRYASYFRQSLHLPDTSSALIECALNNFYKQNLSHQTMGQFILYFRNLLLKEKSGKKRVLEALNLLSDSKIFSGDILSWNNYMERTLILDARDFNGSISMLSAYVEMLLADLYEFQKARRTYCNADTDTPLIIALDEFQCLDPTDTSVLFEIIREGRKSDCCLWLTTQMLSNKLKKITDQMGVSVYFNQGLAENVKSARVLASTAKEQVSAQAALQHLKIGEHIVYQIGKGWISCSAKNPVTVDHLEDSTDAEKIWNV